MLVGRGIYGVVNALLFKAGNYSISIWLASAFITSIPGIIMQLITIPILVKGIEKLIK